MLARTTEHIAQQAQHCSIFGRDPARLDRFKHYHSVQLIQEDYTQQPQFEERLTQLCQHSGPIDLALLWLHASGQKARESIHRKLKHQSTATRLVELYGSAAADPSQSLSHPLKAYEHINVIQVILGFQIEAQGSRWLNHQEISQGALEALSLETSPLIVGQVRPWAARP